MRPNLLLQAVQMAVYMPMSEWPRNEYGGSRVYL